MTMFDDLPSDPFAAAAQTYGPTISEAASILDDHFTTAPRANPAPTDPSYLAFRNITITSDVDGAYTSVNIHFIPLPPTTLAVLPVDGDDNAVTLNWTNPDKNGDPISGYQYSTDGGTTWHPSLDETLINSGATITGLTATEHTFQVRTVTKGFAPYNVSSASVAVTFDRPGRVSLASDGFLATPMLGDMLTATPTDPNMSELAWEGDDVSWQWQRRIVGVPVWTETNILGQLIQAIP